MFRAHLFLIIAYQGETAKGDCGQDGKGEGYAGRNLQRRGRDRRMERVAARLLLHHVSAGSI
jgi:hypothetical protein